MPVKELGFSLLEVLIAMAISSVLLLGAARFLPALQRESLTSTRKLALEDEIWLRVFTVAKHLQRAGYCHGSCTGWKLSDRVTVSLCSGMRTVTVSGIANR